MVQKDYRWKDKCWLWIAVIVVFKEIFSGNLLHHVYSLMDNHSIYIFFILVNGFGKYVLIWHKLCIKQTQNSSHIIDKRVLRTSFSFHLQPSSVICSFSHMFQAWRTPRLNIVVTHSKSCHAWSDQHVAAR